MDERGCDWKVVYATLDEAEAAYWRTPATKPKHGHLLPYRCDEHGGFHLGHFDPRGQRARDAWGGQAQGAVQRSERGFR